MSDLSVYFGRTIVKNQDDVGGREMDVAGVRSVLGVGTNDPPVSPAVGDTYVIGTGTGAWAAHDGHVVRWADTGVWTFEVPFVGWTVSGPDGLWRYSDLDTWVAIADLNDLTATEAALQAQIDVIEADLTAVEADLNALESEVVEAQTDADTALFELGAESEAERHLYVDPVAGSDVNDGLSTTTPVKTAARLFALTPLVTNQPTRVHMASGILDLGGVPIPYGLGSRLLCFHGDEAWDPRGDVYTIVETGVAGVGTSGSNIIAAIAQTLNGRQGMTIRFTGASAAAGQRRTIHSNSTTSFSPMEAFSPAPAAGDIYEIITSNAVILAHQGNLTASNATAVASEGYAFIGVEFDAAATVAVTLGRAHHTFHGCRTRPNIANFSTGDATVRCGFVSSPDQVQTQFGLPVTTQWLGWGLAIDSAVALALITGIYGTVSGKLVCKGSVSNSGRMSLTGGWLSSFTQVTVPGSSANLSGPSTALRMTIGDAAGTATVINITEGELRLGSNCRAQMTHATNPAISVERNGLVIFSNAAVDGSNADAAGPDIRTRYGGRTLITHAGTPGFGKAAGTASWIVEGAASQLKTFFSAAGVALRDAAAPESFARRVA